MKKVKIILGKIILQNYSCKINIKHKKTEIKDGDLIKGFVNKTVVNNLIIGYSWDRYGADKTRNFIDNCQRLIANWLLMDGFSVGLGDAFIKKDVKTKIRKNMEKKK